jgi:hypothetical protein
MRFWRVKHRMQADTDAIRGYGRATVDLGADLRAAAAALPSDLGSTVAGAFGPVGAGFAQALAGAAEALMTGMVRTGEDVMRHGSATEVAAWRYDDVETRSLARIAQVKV